MKIQIICVALLFAGCQRLDEAGDHPIEAAKEVVQSQKPNQKYFCVAPKLEALQDRYGYFTIEASPEWAERHGAKYLWHIRNEKAGGKHDNCWSFGETLAAAVDEAEFNCDPEVVARKDAEYDHRDHVDDPVDQSKLATFRRKLEEELAMCLPKKPQIR